MTDRKDYESLLQDAIDIAERASAIALSYFRQAILIEMKENQTPVTIADKKTEEMIRAELEKKFPTHGILGEEFGHAPRQSDFTWTIDPIDGTRSFIRGIPLFGTLLGVLERGKPVVGVMVLPALDELYAAAKGLGATVNDGEPIHVSATKTLESAIVASGDRNCFEAVGKVGYHNALFQRAELVRGYTDCFGHALVARGNIDAMIDPLVSIWDIAPIATIIEEAGGTYCTLEGEKTIQGTSFMTCTPALKDQLLKLK